MCARPPTTPGFGDWFAPEGAVDWTVYAPVHRDSVTGTVLVKSRATVPLLPIADRPGRAG
ncbi:hypothetical protein [Streptomyces cyaneofuscatus]|uniref:hypothetical protein n=1 Tax=Streptomyces cyaneofuscatus TaxID=66883 RepID=UPI00379617DC